jgi:hypothetical protein
MHPLLPARTSCHISSWRVLRSVLPKNGFYSGHEMLIVTVHTLRQPFPCKLLFSKCWGLCDIRRKVSAIDTTKDTLRVSCWCLSCLEAPAVWGFGEGALQKTGTLQFFYRSGKVCTRHVEHSSIPQLWCPPTLENLSRLG